MVQLTEDVIDEVGIEREFFLLDKNRKIVEPKKYGFPYDEFGFLVEIRTGHYEKARPVLEELSDLTATLKNLANVHGLRMVDVARMPIDKDLIARLGKEYTYDNIPDLTSNVYGIKTSHATGILGDILTAGLHIHVSRKDVYGNKIDLPIEEIVFALDDAFYEDIEREERIRGEYELKPYGFEYRSLPMNVNPSFIVNYMFNLFWRFKE
jgi:hypothetical protein